MGINFNRDFNFRGWTLRLWRQWPPFSTTHRLCLHNLGRSDWTSLHIASLGIALRHRPNYR
jgi:hypothetical protein